MGFFIQKLYKVFFQLRVMKDINNLSVRRMNLGQENDFDQSHIQTLYTERINKKGFLLLCDLKKCVGIEQLSIFSIHLFTQKKKFTPAKF
jgi:hypothetical protein